MKKLTSELTLIASQLQTPKARFVFFLITLGLFIIGAAAPEAAGLPGH